MEQNQRWYEHLKRERIKHGWSQEDLAERIGSSTKTISRWERGGGGFPGPFNRQRLAEVFEKSIEELGLIEQDGGVLEREGEAMLHRSQYEDWGEAPDVEHFYGRTEELDQLRRWIIDEHCRMVILLGMGGVGKTTLAIAVAKQIQVSHPFEYIYWRSLRNAPPVESLLENCLQHFHQERAADLAGNLDKQISLLMACLREHRCLLILDNVESVLRAGQHSGQYLESYEGYGALFRRIGETSHRSCLVLTSREKPGEIARLEGTDAPVRSLRLAGMEEVSGQELLQGQGLSGNDEAWAALVRRYSGNPLALKLVAEPVREVFNGDIVAFLEGEEAVFGDIFDLLEQQFWRLSIVERNILYWLAIERESVTLQTLKMNIQHRLYGRALLEALDSLRRRSLIEMSNDGKLLLLPLIMEYMTGKFVAQMIEEVEAEKPELFGSHTLMKAEGADYIRKSQVHFILEPIIKSLHNAWGKAGSERKLRQILNGLHAHESLQSSYAAGNILNLLVQSGADLRGLDSSHLTVRHAYLQDVSLPEVNFSHADLETCTFTDTFSNVLCVAVSPDGVLLAGGTTTGEVRLWRIDNAMALLTCVGHMDGIRSVAFSPDGRMFASGSEDHTVRVWDSSSGHCLNILTGHTNGVLSVAFSPDGKLIASAGLDQVIRLWDVNTGACLLVLQGHAGWVRAVCFAADGKQLASGSNDQTIRLWDIDTGECIQELREHTGWVRAMAFAPDGKVLASGSEDRSVRFWNIDTGECLRVLQEHTDRVRTVAWISDGTVLVSGSDDQTIRLWDAGTGECFKILRGHTNRIWSLAVVPSSRILVSASEDDTIRFWDSASGQCTRILRGRTSLVKAVAFSPDGRKLVSGSEDQLVRVWDVDSGQCVRTLHKHSNRVRCVAYSPDGRKFASGSEDETICIWNASSGECMKVLRGHTNLVRSIDFNADGGLLASGSNDRTIRVWDIRTGECLKIIDGYSLIWSVAFSSDGKMLASGGDDWSVRLWDAGTGAALRTLEGHTHRIWAVAFDPASEMLASSSDDEVIRLWNISTGECFNILRGHTSWVRSVAFSPDGKVIASGSHDRTVRIWDTLSGQCLKVLRGHDNCVWSVAFDPVAGILASAGDDGSVRLWDIHRAECVKTLRSEKLYEGMNIVNTKGLTDAQKTALRTLGAVE